MKQFLVRWLSNRLLGVVEWLNGCGPSWFMGLTDDGFRVAARTKGPFEGFSEEVAVGLVDAAYAVIERGWTRHKQRGSLQGEES